MLKIDIYEKHCLIWFENLDNATIDTIVGLIVSENLKCELHNKSVTVYSPTYSLLYELSMLSYILLQ